MYKEITLAELLTLSPEAQAHLLTLARHNQQFNMGWSLEIADKEVVLKEKREEDHFV